MERSAIGIAIFQPLFEPMQRSVVITTEDPHDPRIIYVNPAFERLTGYTFAEVKGCNPKLLQGADTDPGIISGLRAALYEGQHFLARTTNYRKGGEAFMMEWIVHPVFKRDGKVGYFVAFQQEADPDGASPVIPLHHPELDLLQLMLTVQDLERERIARDLHDSLGQLLAAARMQANADAKTNPAMLELLDKAITENRNITFNLMPEALRSRGLNAALRELALRASTRETSVVHRTLGSVCYLVDWQGFSLFRIAQEAVQNALRHARTDMILVLETYHPTQYELLIRDFGAGLPATRIEQVRKSESQHSGLRNMELRAEMIQARFELFSLPEEGTTVRVTLDRPMYTTKPSQPTPTGLLTKPPR